MRPRVCAHDQFTASPLPAMVPTAHDGGESTPSDAAARAVCVKRGAEHLRAAIGEVRIELARHPNKTTKMVLAEKEIRDNRTAILADRKTRRASCRARADALGHEWFVPFEVDLLETCAVLAVTLAESCRAVDELAADRALAIAAVEYLDDCDSMRLERFARTTTVAVCPPRDEKK